MDPVAQVGVRELRQNLSVYLARIALGETFEVTDRGHAVAVLAPITRASSVFDRLQLEGRLVRASGNLLAAARPKGPMSRRGSRALQKMRSDRRL